MGDNGELVVQQTCYEVEVSCATYWLMDLKNK